MMDFMTDLWGFMKERKKFWMAPIIVVMLLLGALIVLTQGSAVAPFIVAFRCIPRLFTSALNSPINGPSPYTSNFVLRSNSGKSVSSFA